MHKDTKWAQQIIALQDEEGKWQVGYGKRLKRWGIFSAIERLAQERNKRSRLY